MKVSLLLAILWFVVVGFWILNHFYYANVKYEQQYKRGEHPHY